MSKSLVVITGASAGIGAAIARAFSAAGHPLLLLARRVEPMQALNLPDTLCIGVDVTDTAAMKAAVQQAEAKFGPVGCMVNNAGVMLLGQADVQDPTEWQQMLKINVMGVLNGVHAVLAGMKERRSGTIINISSIAGQVALKRQAPYCASKGGVEQLTRALAVDWAEHGVRVNTIGYGFVETDLTRSLLHHPHLGGMVRTRTPLGRPGLLGEVGGAAVFLASDAASYVTGHSLMVDGGWTAA